MIPKQKENCIAGSAVIAAIHEWHILKMLNSANFFNFSVNFHDSHTHFSPNHASCVTPGLPDKRHV